MIEFKLNKYRNRNVDLTALEYLLYGNTWTELEYIPLRIASRSFNDRQKSPPRKTKECSICF